MINILFVLNQMATGGAERVVLDLTRSLSYYQYGLFVAAFNGGSLEHSLRKNCTEVFIIDKKEGFDFSAMYQLSHIFRKYSIDIVNAHHYMPLFYCFLGSKIISQRNLIYTEHSVPEVEGIASSTHRKIFNLMLFRINAVIGVSKEITYMLKKLYPRHADKLHEVLNGVDIDKFRIKSSRVNVLKRWGLSKEDFVVGTVANFRKVKNHVCLVRAAARLKDSHPQLRLLFVGMGFPGDLENSEDEVRSLIQGLGLQDRVILAGYQENIPEILAALDAFCLPSISEGMPVSILEAMAAGVPVVGSDVRGINEVVINRETGLLFLPDNDLDLARLLVEIIESRSFANLIAFRAFNYVKNKHSKNAWVEKTLNILLNS